MVSKKKNKCFCVRIYFHKNKNISANGCRWAHTIPISVGSASISYLSCTYLFYVSSFRSSIACVDRIQAYLFFKKKLVLPHNCSFRFLAKRAYFCLTYHCLPFDQNFMALRVRNTHKKKAN